MRTDDFDPPRFLYRFRNVGTDHLKDELLALLQGKVFLSSAAGMNDPFEVSPYIEESPLPELNRVFSKRKMERKFKKKSALRYAESKGISRKRIPNRKFQNKISMIDFSVKSGKKILSEQQRQSYIACFCANSDSLLMWSHYAGSHKGFCVEFEVDLEGVSRGTPTFPLRVVYRELRPKVSTAELLELSAGSGRKLDGIIERIYLTKSHDWSYEKEWRLFEHNGPGYVELDHLKPKRIILGVRMAEKDEADIKRIINGRLDIVKARMSKDSFSVVF